MSGMVRGMIARTTMKLWWWTGRGTGNTASFGSVWLRGGGVRLEELHV